MDHPDDSRRQPSLDEIISQLAVVISEQIQLAAGWAKSETDLQIEVAGMLKDFARKAKINPLELHHNVTIATGHQDSVYGSVIVEYKVPGTLSSSKAAAPNKAVIEQLKRYFYDTKREQNKPWNSMFGVATDGKYFIFLRFRDDKWTDQEPLPVDRNSTKRFLWALYNLGEKGKPYQPEYLHGDFGSDSPVAQEGVRALYEEILATENPKAQVFFNQWKILFGEVCGYDVDNLSDKLNKLAEFYVVKGKTQPAQLLFAVHTYYAILIKLLASEIVSFFNPWMTRQVEKLQSATTSAKLKRELEDLEQGGVFHTLGITNFLEGDLFAWYLGAWGAPIEKLVRAMVTKLDLYNPGTFSEDPAQSRDLLKKLYQQLFPKPVRHDLGEYYTPDWLAEHVLNELGYEGDPDKRILDPACGSGTFLVMAINRIRHWYDANREKCAYDEGDLLKKILANVIGFDLNPLAVMAARTNYLVAIKDLIRHVEAVEIPVYLCDSIMTPAEYGDLFTGGQGKVAKVPCSAMKPPHLLVPNEIAQNPKDVAMYAQILETCVKNAYAPEEFLSRCRDEGLNVTATDAHLDLYKELVILDKANKNGIWARIIKNNFAPLFVGRVDFIAGNPPWINLENLPGDYRKTVDPLWEKYGLKHSLGGPQIGSTKKDICSLFVHSSSDHFLKLESKIGFVLTQSLFKSKGGGDGFRSFSYQSSEGRIFLHPLVVHDLSDFSVFEGATNRTAVIVCKKRNKGFKYPVRYVVWQPKEISNLPEDWPIERAFSDTKRITLEAIPSDPERTSSPWLTVAPECLDAIQKVRGRNLYRAYTGVYTGGLNGAYWLHRIGSRGGKDLFENLWDVGKKHVARVVSSLDEEIVYPLLRGRDVHRWTSKPSAEILIPYDRLHNSWFDESTMKRNFHKTYEFLANFRADLAGRKTALVRQQTKRGPFYAMVAVGEYTFAPWKVIYKRLSDTMQAAVVPGNYMPHEKLILIPTQTPAEAHYVAALLNSAPANLLLRSAAVRVQTIEYAPSDVSHLTLPPFSPDRPLHLKLSNLSVRCHDAAERSDDKRVSELELQIDGAAAKLWGVTDDELKAIHNALAETSKSKNAAEEDDEE